MGALALIERSFRIRGEVVPEGVGVESKGGGGAPPLPWGRVIDKRALARRFQLVETESSLSASRVGEKNDRLRRYQICKRQRASERKGVPSSGTHFSSLVSFVSPRTPRR